MNTKTTRQPMKPTKTKRPDWSRSYEAKMETLRRKNVRTEKYRKTEVTL